MAKIPLFGWWTYPLVNPIWQQRIITLRGKTCRNWLNLIMIHFYVYIYYIYLLIYLSIYWFIYSFIDVFIYLFIYWFIYSFIDLFIDLFIYLLISSCQVTGNPCKCSLLKNASHPELSDHIIVHGIPRLGTESFGSRQNMSNFNGPSLGICAS